MKMRKVLCATLAAVMAIGMLAGCNNGKSSSSVAENYKDTDEKLTLKWLGYPVSAGAEEEGYTENLLEEKFNVEIEPLFYEENKYNDKKTMLMAGGEIPDLIYELDPMHVFNDVEQDFLAELPYETVEEYAPEYFKYLNEYAPAAWLYSRYDDKNWGLPNFNHSHMVSKVATYRKDWLDKFGLEVPKTLDELHTALYKFANEDPDGNGKKDTYGISWGYNNFAFFFPEIFGAYGCLPFDWQEVDGKIVYGGLTDGCKEALKTLAQWYKEGIVHPDFALGESDTKKMNSNALGYTTVPGYQDASDSGSLCNTVPENIPGAELTTGFLPVGPDGQSGARSWGRACHVVAFGNGDGYGAKVPRMLKMIEAMFVDKDLATKIRIGEENVHWTKEHNPNGALNFAMKPEYAESNTRIKGFDTMFQGPTFFAPVPSDYDLYWNTRSDNYKAWAEEYTDEKYALCSPFFKVDIVPSASDYIIDLRTKQMSIMNEIIQGKKTIDDYAEFEKIWETSGGKILTEEANALKKDAEKVYKEIGIK